MQKIIIAAVLIAYFGVALAVHQKSKDYMFSLAWPVLVLAVLLGQVYIAYRKLLVRRAMRKWDK